MKKYKFVSKKEILESKLDEEEIDVLENIRSGSMELHQLTMNEDAMFASAAKNFLKKTTVSNASVTKAKKPRVIKIIGRSVDRAYHKRVA